MAAPVDAGRAGYTGSSAATSHNVTLPASIAAGDLLLCHVRIPLGNSIQVPTGWTALVSNGTDTSSDDKHSIFWRKADGAEGSTVNVSTAPDSSKMAAVTWRITGAEDPTRYPPQITTAVTGSSTTPDPGSITPSRGTDDYLFVWMGSWAGEQTSPPTGTPTGYSNANGGNTGTQGTTATNCRVAGATKGVTGTSAENPGSWTISATGPWSAYTVAVIQPATAKAGTDSGSGSEGTVGLAAAFPRTDVGGVPAGTASVTAAATVESELTIAGGVAWNSYINAMADDASNDTHPNLIGSTNYIALKGFGLSIPTGATIDQVRVWVNAWSSGNIGNASLSKSSVTADQATPQALTTTGGNQVVGGDPTTVWGYSMSPADLNSSSFTILLQGGDDGFSTAGSVDAAWLEVYYSTSTGESAVTASDSSAKSGTDSATGTEGTSVLAVDLPRTESSTGTEVSALAAAITATADTGSGTEASTLDQAYIATDTGAGTDAGDGPGKAAADTGTGADASTESVTFDDGLHGSFPSGTWTPMDFNAGTPFDGSVATTSNSNWYGGPFWTLGSGVYTASGVGVNAFSEDLRLLAWNFNADAAHRPRKVIVEFNWTQQQGTSVLGIQLTKDGGSTAYKSASIGGPNDKGYPSRVIFDVYGSCTIAELNSANFGVLFYGDTGANGDTFTVKDIRVSIVYEQEDVALVRDGISDSGTGADSGTVTVPVNATPDTGSGAEVSALAVDLPQVDSGSGADASTLVAVLSATEDTGSGADAGTLAAAYALTDAGTGAESATVGVATLSATDTGTGDDVSTLVAVYAVTDTGSGADASALVADLAAVDSGAGLDASSLFTEDPNKVAADAGAGAEASALTVDLPQVDSGSAADASTLTVVYAATDTGSGADASTLDQAYIATDTGAGVEEAVVLAVAIPVTEAGTGSEASALVADLAATDSGTDSEAGSVDTGIVEKAGSDSGAGSEIVGAFERVLHDRARVQVQINGYGSYDVPPQRGWWEPAGNADWSGIGTSEEADYPRAWQDDFPYSTYKSTVTVPSFGITDYANATYFPGLYDNWNPTFLQYGSPADRPMYLSFTFRTVAAQSGCTLEGQLTKNGVPFGNYKSVAIPAGTNTITLEADVNGSGYFGGTAWATTAQGLVEGGDLAHPRFGVRFSIWSNRATDTVIDIEKVTLNTLVATPPFTAAQGIVQEQGALNFAATDTGSGADSSSLAAAITVTEHWSSAEAEQWSNLDIGAHGYDEGVGTESAFVSISIAGADSSTGSEVSLLEALIGGTETGSSSDFAGQLGLLTTDQATGVESLGSRVFAATELISTLDVGDANWWLVGALTDNTLALTATSAGTESLTPATAGTETLTPVSTVSEVLATASVDTSLVLNPIDYEPQ